MTVLQIEKRLAKLESQVRSLVAGQKYDSAIEGIRQGLRQMDQGKGIPVEEAFARIRKPTKSARKRRS